MHTHKLFYAVVLTALILAFLAGTALAGDIISNGGSGGRGRGGGGRGDPGVDYIYPMPTDGPYAPPMPTPTYVKPDPTVLPTPVPTRSGEFEAR